MIQRETGGGMTLDRMQPGDSGRITSIDWSPLDVREARRLRELGLEEGATVEMLHRGVLFFWKDPLAVRIGRMTIAIRKAHAAQMQVVAA
jgi:ferrous iron transport protein A